MNHGPLRAALLCVVLGGLLLLGACAAPPGPPRLDLTATDFTALEGWRDDAQGAALTAFRRSCDAFAKAPDDQPVAPLGGTVGDWREPCAAAGRIAAGDDSLARRFFETWFTPLRASDRGADRGLFTGYYEALLHGARQPGGAYTVPIHGLPAGLVSVDLGRFAADLEGRRIVGRTVDGALEPLPERAAIDHGALDGAAPVIAWVDDPLDAYFLHVQGSGRIALAGGGELRVGYADANGHAYVSIGQALIERGALTREEVTLQSIRAWLAANPIAMAEVLALNPSYVFFRLVDGAMDQDGGPFGAQGVALTPGRSLAVDRRFLPLGAPLWLDIMAPATDEAAPDRRLRRLVIAQDTGGAIRGPLRGDLFWGFGAAAESIAGRLKHPGGYVLLLPNAVAERLP